MKYDDTSDADNDNGNDNDSNKAPVAVTRTGGALASVSLEALKVALNGVDTRSGDYSGLPMMQFKRDGNGTYMFGQKHTVPEEGSHWAIHPVPSRGYAAFVDGNKKPEERMLPITEPMPDLATLPDKGSEWKEQWTVHMKCLNGADREVEVIFKTTTVGGIQAVRDILVPAIRDRLNSDQHDGKVAPIVLLEKDSYPHNQYGKVWFPVFTIVDWMSMSGPVRAPAPKSPSPTTTPDQPRRRRVVG